MTTLRSGEKKDVNLAIRSSSFFLLLLPPPPPSSNSLSFFPATVIKANLRQIASKLVDGFFLPPRGSESHRARGGASNAWRPAHVCTYQRSYVTRTNYPNFTGVHSIGTWRTRHTRTHASARSRVDSSPRVPTTNAVDSSKKVWLEGGERFLSEEEKDKGAWRRVLCTTCLSSIYFRSRLSLRCPLRFVRIYFDTDCIFDHGRIIHATEENYTCNIWIYRWKTDRYRE